MPWLNPQVVFLVVVIVGIVFLIIKIIEQKNKSIIKALNSLEVMGWRKKQY